VINIREFLGLGYYTSELDNFLVEFDKTKHKLSASQRKEVDKYNRVFAMRDNPQQSKDQETFWDQF